MIDALIIFLNAASDHHYWGCGICIYGGTRQEKNGFEQRAPRKNNYTTKFFYILVKACGFLSLFQ